jgi:hypothetical protein
MTEIVRASLGLPTLWAGPQVGAWDLGFQNADEGCQNVEQSLIVNSPTLRACCAPLSPHPFRSAPRFP